MTSESASDRQQTWTFLARRSFGIPESVGDEDARRILVSHIEIQLQENGWRSAPHAVAEPMLDALIALGASGDLDDQMLPEELRVPAESVNTRDAAHRILDKGISVVDPEYLVYDTRSEYPPEIVAVAQQVLDLIFAYIREQPFDD
jgi:hypothetical protein